MQIYKVSKTSGIQNIGLKKGAAYAPTSPVRLLALEKTSYCRKKMHTNVEHFD
jgi:hypothetical protein